MANNYTSPDKTASVAFRPNGVYAGIVTRVDTGLQRVWVMIPRIANGFQFGPLSVATTILPIVGDRVACMFVEDRQDDLVILGSLKNSNSPVYTASVTCTSTTRPTDPPVGTQIYETDTTKTLIWNGSSWTGLNIDTLLVDNNTLYIDATNNRVGVNTGAPTVALDVVGAIKSSTSITATTSVSAYDVTATGTVSGASVTASGPVSGASLSVSGTASVGSISTSGAAQVGTLTSSGAAQATRLTLTQTTGTAPITVSSTTVVSNLNADLLDGQEGSYYQNASNLSSGTLLADRLPAFSGDASSTAGTASLTLATVNTNTGSFGSSIVIPAITVNGKGLVTAVATNTVRSASTTQTGVVQLNNTVTSTSTTEAATANAVKSAYDLAAAALPKSGGTMSGTLDMGNNQLRLRTSDGNHSLIYNSTIDGAELKGWDRIRLYVGNNARTFDFKNNGSATAPGTWIDNSSIRFKTDIEDFFSTSSLIDGLRPITYVYANSADTRRYLGFVAEEVEQVLPEIVEYDKDGLPEGLSYGRLSVIAIAEIKALRKRVAELEERCAG